ncbi:MAG: hypothetical protein AAFX94_11675 [Myxococcota bacterium]
MTAVAEELRERSEALRLRIAVAVFAAVLLVAMIASMHLSTLELSFGSLVYGSPRVWPGHQATLRVAAVDPSANLRTVPITGGEVVIYDAFGERVRHPLSGHLSEVHLPIPEDLQYEARAEIRVVTEFGEDRFTQSLIPVSAPVSGSAEVRSHRKLLARRGRPRPGGPNELRLYPQSGVLVDGLPNTVTVWALDQGTALETSLHSDAIGFRTATDRDGLATIQWLPRPNPIGFPFVLGETDTVTLPAELEQRQLVASTPSLLVSAGEPLPLTVHSLPTREPVSVDLWLGDVLAYGQQVTLRDGKGTLEIPIPRDYEGLARVDVYRSIFAPESSSSSLTLWVSDAPRAEAASDATAHLQGLEGADPALAGAGQDPRFTELALSRTRFDRVGVQLLRTTVDERLQAVRKQKANLRGTINGVFTLTFIFGLLLLSVWAVRHQLRVKANVEDVVSDGIARGEAIDPETVSGLTRFRFGYEVAVVIAGLALAGYSILTLLQTIRWYY